MHNRQHQQDSCEVITPLQCKYLTGIDHAKGITLLAAGGTANHIHLLIALPPTVALSKVMQDFKGNSSHWQNQRGKKFAWQEGFGAFGVSQSNKQVVAHYIGVLAACVRDSA